MKTQGWLVSNPTVRHRIDVGLRTGLAAFGGYGLALLGAAALAAGLPFDFKPDAVSLAVMLGFLLHLTAVLWAFAAATLLRAALGLAVPAAFFGLWLLSLHYR
ncbi:MAG: iron transporter [Candidatus Accumulibacter sp.]|nr:iron transporter [Accumulibacter sp.]